MVSPLKDPQKAFNAEIAVSLAEDLPASWPMWCNPDYSAVEKEIKADPRWEAWVEKTMHADA